MKIITPLIVIAALAAIPWGACSQEKVSIRPDLISPKSIAQWEIDGSGVWTISEGKLVITKAGVPSGPIRRPAAFAILNMKPLQSVTVDADIRSTAPLDVIRRDLDFVVGYESPTRFYYVHLAGINDSVHNGIFLVDNADRRRIDSGTGKPQLRDSLWHHVRVERDGASGRISVYAGQSKVPVLQAVDKTICCGRVGLGSFDDTGEFRRITIGGFAR